MTITIPDPYIYACLGSLATLATLATVAGLLWALAKAQGRQKRGRG